MNKKIISLLLAVLLVFSLVACSGGSNEGGEGSGKVVVYSPNSENIVGTIVPMFEEATGIEVELISAGTGELISRIEAEKDNPAGDVLFGGSKSTIREKADLFEQYVSVNDDAIMADHKNVDGFLTPYTADGSVILVNTDLIGDIEINGFADLLNPELKGKIAY